MARKGPERRPHLITYHRDWYVTPRLRHALPGVVTDNESGRRTIQHHLGWYVTEPAMLGGGTARDGGGEPRRRRDARRRPTFPQTAASASSGRTSSPIATRPGATTSQ